MQEVCGGRLLRYAAAKGLHQTVLAPLCQSRQESLPLSLPHGAGRTLPVEGLVMMAGGGSEARLHHEAAFGGGCALTHCHLLERSGRTDPVRKEREGQTAASSGGKNPPNGDAQRHLAKELVNYLFFATV